MKKTYSQARNQYFVKLLRGVPFPPEPLPERTQRQKDEAKEVLAMLAGSASTTMYYRI